MAATVMSAMHKETMEIHQFDPFFRMSDLHAKVVTIVTLNSSVAMITVTIRHDANIFL